LLLYVELIGVLPHLRPSVAVQLHIFDNRILQGFEPLEKVFICFPTQ
jgi:hypothetical protein